MNLLDPKCFIILHLRCRTTGRLEFVEIGWNYKGWATRSSMPEDNTNYLLVALLKFDTDADIAEVQMSNSCWKSSGGYLRTNHRMPSLHRQNALPRH